MKVLYEASILSNYRKKTGYGRTGLYYVALGQLEQLLTHSEVELSLYCQLKDASEVRRMCHDYKWDVPVLTETAYPLRTLCSHGIGICDRMEEKGTPIKGKRMMNKAYLFSVRNFYHRDKKRFAEFDAFISPCFPEPYVVRLLGIKTYTVIHDVIPYKAYTYEIPKEYWLSQVLSNATMEHCYFCISEHTRKDFLECCPCVDPKKTFTVYNGFSRKSSTPLSQSEQCGKLRKYGLSAGNFILIFGSVVDHKNILLQIKAAVEFIQKNQLHDGSEKFRVAVAGMCSDKEKFLDNADLNMPQRDLICFLGYVPDEMVAVLYRNAFCLSFTSLYEGFGLPVLEAMDCGCPVVTSNTTSLPEVSGDAAICINPLSLDSHVNAYEKLYHDRETRENLIRKGIENTQRFSWKKNIQEILAQIKCDSEYGMRERITEKHGDKE